MPAMGGMTECEPGAMTTPILSTSTGNGGLPWGLKACLLLEVELDAHPLEACGIVVRDDILRAAPSP